MAVVRAILQPLVAGDLHVTEVRALLKAPWASRFVISSAYLNAAGARTLAAELAGVGKRGRALIGVRNGFTTGQGVAALLKAGVPVYAVDTATRFRIFHPKVFVAHNRTRASVIIGSSNLTHPGLHNNIEAGAYLDLDLSDPSDRAFLTKIRQHLQLLPRRFPKNCYRISSLRQVVRMLRDGLLEDEREQSAVTPVSVGTGSGSKAAIAPIPLPSARAPTQKRRRAKSKTYGTAKSTPHYGSLLWEKRLPPSDLQFTGTGAPTGVARLTQARFRVGGTFIDQTTYFRTIVFGGLPWTVDPNDPGKEMAEAAFSLVIAGVYVGDFRLRLSHKPAWAAGQGNYTTALHWGAATPQIRNQQLVGRTLRLYAPALPGNPYILDID